MQRQLFRMPKIIRIQKSQKAAPCCLKPQIARNPRTVIAPGLQQMDTRIGGDMAQQNIQRAIL